jgi:hypothetical protein
MGPMFCPVAVVSLSGALLSIHPITEERAHVRSGHFEVVRHIKGLVDSALPGERFIQASLGGVREIRLNSTGHQQFPRLACPEDIEDRTPGRL